MMLPALERMKAILDLCFKGRSVDDVSLIEGGAIRAAQRYMKEHPVYQSGGPELSLETFETWVDLLFFPPSRRKTLSGLDLKMGIKMAIGSATRLEPKFKETMHEIFSELGVADTLLANAKVPSHPDGGYDVSKTIAIQAAESRVRVKVVQELSPELAQQLQSGELDMDNDCDAILAAVVERVGGENVKMEVSDLLRCLACFDSAAGVAAAVEKLRARFQVTRVVNKMATPLRQVMVNFRFEGLVAEAQLVCTGALAPGSTEYHLWKWGHVAYEIARAEGRVKAVLDEKVLDAGLKQWQSFRGEGGDASDSIAGLLQAVGFSHPPPAAKGNP